MDPNNPTVSPSGVTINTTTKSTIQTRNLNNMIFAVVLILYQILTLPIYGVLFRLNGHFLIFQDYGGILLMSISTILLIVGFGLINGYLTQYSLSGMTYTLVIFALTVQHFFLFRAFWNKAGANDYDLNSKGWSTWYNLVSLSNYQVDRQFTSLLPSGPFVQAIAQAISISIAFSSIVGRVGLLQVFILTIFGSMLYEVNAQLIYRWFITDNGFGCRIFLFGSIVGVVVAVLLGRKQTTIGHTNYKSQYRNMCFAMLGFLFVCISLPTLSGISIFTRTATDNAVLYASHINAWLAVLSSVLGTFTASAFLYRKFSVFDLVFAGISGAVALAMQADICFNPCVPLIVGFVIGFMASIYPALMHRKANSNGVLFTFPVLNNYLVPSFFACIVSAIVQACLVSANGQHTLNMLNTRTAIQQGGWQMVGFLITAGTAILAGLVIGVLIKIINKHEYQDQFNDSQTYINVPNPSITD